MYKENIRAVYVEFEAQKESKSTEELVSDLKLKTQILQFLAVDYLIKDLQTTERTLTEKLLKQNQPLTEYLQFDKKRELPRKKEM